MSTTETSVTPLTISQITNLIKQHLEPRFKNVFIQGEISNFTCHTASGHLYFTLKDASAQIGAVMFRQEASTIRPQPKVGDHVIVRGELSLYPPQGNYKIIVRELYYVGLGALLLKFEELKKKLQQLGWFNEERKKPLPFLPRTIGVVTSPTGAVIQDILKVLGKRFPGFHVILNPVRVQGEGAAEEIAQAIEYFNRTQLVDVMIIGRGGGSLEDLWAFNEERVAAAVYSSLIPIISAVGHETDIALTDFVADLRAPTPSAAAQIVIPEKEQLLQGLLQINNRLKQSLTQHILHRQKHLSGIKRHPIFIRSSALIGNFWQRLDDLTQRIDHSMHLKITKNHLKLSALANQVKAIKPDAYLANVRTRCSNIDKSLKASILQRIFQMRQHLRSTELQLLGQIRHRARICRKQFDSSAYYKKFDGTMKKQLALKRERLMAIIKNLHSIDPRNLLKKGYSILFSEKDHSLIISTDSLSPNQELRAQLSDGSALVTVNKVFKNSH